MAEKRTVPIFERKGVFFAMLVFLCLVTLVISTKSLLISPKQFGLTLVSAIQKGVSSVGEFFSDTVLAIKEIDTLRSDYADALSQLEKFRNIERGYMEIRAENERLREQLDFSQQIPYRHIAAKIIAKDPENIFTAITIDKGSREGVKRELPVIAIQEGIRGIVGKITDVGLHSSMVLPVYDSYSFISARMEKSRFEGLVNGQGQVDSPLIMKYVNKRAKDSIQFGDTVITSGLNSLFPEGLYIGRVRNIRIRDYDTSLNVELESVIDYTKLEYVFVLSAQDGTSD
jgi:rod shape-determining protein MreC